MQASIVTIVRTTKAQGQTPGLYMHVNQMFVDQFGFSVATSGSIASFSIRGCTFHIHLFLLSSPDDSSKGCVANVTDSMLQLTGLKAGLSYLVTYQPRRRRFVIGNPLSPTTSSVQ